MNILLNLAYEKDFFSLAEIYVEEFTKEPFNEKWTVKKALKKINLCSKYCDIFKIVFDSRIIGFLIVNKNFWDFEECVFGEDIGIKKEFQNKGNGKIVFEKVFEFYKKKGYKKFYGIVIGNRLKFYQNLGFEVSKSSFFSERVL